MADITMTNGADINMTDSDGSTIIFPDGTIQSTAAVAGPQGDPGADGGLTPLMVPVVKLV
jgi:hypothetical protein